MEDALFVYVGVVGLRATKRMCCPLVYGTLFDALSGRFAAAQ